MQNMKRNTTVISRRNFLNILLKGSIVLGGLGSGLTLFPQKAFADQILALDDKFEPASFAEIPFVYPFNRKSFSKDNWGNTNIFGNIHQNIVPGSHHTGEDWLLNKNVYRTSGKSFYAVNHGVVIYAKSYPLSKLGNLVIIKHKANLQETFQIPEFHYERIKREEYNSVVIYSYYLHLKEVNVEVGENVRKGMEIGKTYLASEKVNGKYEYWPHLHFEMWSRIKVNNNDTYNDSQGYDPPGQFGSSVKKLVGGSSFIDENNSNKPLILGMPQQTYNGYLTIRGLRFGDYPGKIIINDKPSGNYVYDLSAYSGNSVIWEDNRITFSLKKCFPEGEHTSPFISGIIDKPVSIQVIISKSTKKAASNIKYYPFSDVIMGQWYSNCVFKLWKKGVINGYIEKNYDNDYMSSLYSNRYFGYWKKITRAQFIKMLIKSAGKEDTLLQSSADFPYSDVNENDWFYTYIKIAYKLNWIEEKSKFWPDEPITRAEVAKLLVIALGKENEIIPYYDKLPYSKYIFSNSFYLFEDVKSSDWFYKYVYICKKQSIFEGYHNKADDKAYFKPNSPINRAEVAVVVYRAFNK